MKRVVFPLFTGAEFLNAMLKRLIKILCLFCSMTLAAIMGGLVASLRCPQRPHRTEATPEERQPEIIVFWHEHPVCDEPVLPAGCSALQSPHPDGRVLAGASRLFELRPIWGSNNRNARQACARWPTDQSRRSAVITPGRPRGPARRCQ